MKTLSMTKCLPAALLIAGLSATAKAEPTVYCCEKTAWETTKQVATAAAFVPVYIAAPAILIGTGAVLLVGKITYDAGMLAYNAGKASYQLAEYVIRQPEE